LKTVESAVQAYFDALNRSDAEGITGVFAQDARLMADGVDTVTGRVAIRQLFETQFQALGFGRVLHIDLIREQGNVATARTNTTGTIKLLADGTQVPAVSRELFVLGRSGNGWKITDYIFNRVAPSVE
jgi:uncharacterized protein (TIGR02246 family)